MVECPSCNGYGSHQFCGGATCEDCDGTGQFSEERRQAIQQERQEFHAKLSAIALDTAAKLLADTLGPTPVPVDQGRQLFSREQLVEYATDAILKDRRRRKGLL